MSFRQVDSTSVHYWGSGYSFSVPRNLKISSPDIIGSGKSHTIGQVGQKLRSTPPRNGEYSLKTQRFSDHLKPFLVSSDLQEAYGRVKEMFENSVCVSASFNNSTPFESDESLNYA